MVAIVETKKKSTKKTPKKSSAAKKTAAPKKKSAPKKAAKKTAKKATKKSSKKVSKEAVKKAVKKNVHPDKMFIMVNGHKLKNVKELADVMEKIEDHVFNHHVTEDKNDFAQWLHDVFEEIDLAKEVAGCKEKKHIQLVLYRHISKKLW